MVIIKFSGALGNQLFEYAFYKKISMKTPVKADLSNFDKGLEQRKFYLEELDIKLDHSTREDLRKYSFNIPVLNGLKKRLGFINVYNEKESYVFDEEALHIEDGYLDGYWQCPKYFDDIKEDIIKDIRFPELLNEQAEIKSKMESCNSVSIHVRMGDYLKFKDKYGNICSIDYYKKAIDIIKSKVSDPVFYGFSDDIDMASELLSDEDICWIRSNSEDNAYNDMNLMSSCRHNIIANSSFSWWGAYLGTYKDKIVIAPSKWTNTSNRCYIWCDNWIRV